MVLRRLTLHPGNTPVPLAIGPIAQCGDIFVGFIHETYAPIMKHIEHAATSMPASSLGVDKDVDVTGEKFDNSGVGHTDSASDFDGDVCA